MPIDEQRITSPLKAIRQKCLDCVWGNATEVRLCPSESCPLFPFRFGKNPFKPKREYTEQQRKDMAERLKLVRERRQDVKKAETNAAD